jgi:hypothetical protein
MTINEEIKIKFKFSLIQSELREAILEYIENNADIRNDETFEALKNAKLSFIVQGDNVFGVTVFGESN